MADKNWDLGFLELLFFPIIILEDKSEVCGGRSELMIDDDDNECLLKD